MKANSSWVKSEVCKVIIALSNCKNAHALHFCQETPSSICHKFFLAARQFFKSW